MVDREPVMFPAAIFHSKTKVDPRESKFVNFAYAQRPVAGDELFVRLHRRSMQEESGLQKLRWNFCQPDAIADPQAAPEFLRQFQ